MNIFYNKNTGLTMYGLTILILLFFSILYVLSDKQTEKISNILYTITSVAIMYTAYQAYSSYNFQTKIGAINQNITGYMNILDVVDNETYKRWNPNLNGLTIEQHKLMSLVGIQIENAEKFYGFSTMKDKPKDGWYQQLKIWILDPMFIKYWQTDYKTYSQDTVNLVNSILNETSTKNNYS